MFFSNYIFHHVIIYSFFFCFDIQTLVCLRFLHRPSSPWSFPPYTLNTKIPKTLLLPFPPLIHQSALRRLWPLGCTSASQQREVCPVCSNTSRSIHSSVLSDLSHYAMAISHKIRPWATQRVSELN